MFVNEFDGRKGRTIDTERGITLELKSGSREGVETFILTIGDKIIPFTATSELLPLNEDGLNPKIWTVIGMGYGSFRDGTNLFAKPSPAHQISYKFSSSDEVKQVFKIIQEAMRVYGGRYGKGKVVVIDVKLDGEIPDPLPF